MGGGQSQEKAAREEEGRARGPLWVHTAPSKVGSGEGRKDVLLDRPGAGL